MTDEAPARGPGRPRNEMRPAMRPDDSRARAEARAAELLGTVDFDETARDEFRAPPPPDGWTYEWKRHTTLGATNPSYEVDLAQMGWEPVPAERHPDMMPGGWAGASIEKKGMILMERPAIITERVRKRDYTEARERVDGVTDRLRTTGKGEFSREKSNGESLIKVGKSYSPIAIPE